MAGAIAITMAIGLVITIISLIFIARIIVIEMKFVLPRRGVALALDNDKFMTSPLRTMSSESPLGSNSNGDEI